MALSMKLAPEKIKQFQRGRVSGTHRGFFVLTGFGLSWKGIPSQPMMELLGPNAHATHPPR